MMEDSAFSLIKFAPDTNLAMALGAAVLCDGNQFLSGIAEIKVPRIDQTQMDISFHLLREFTSLGIIQ
jgi:hypothetical protein